MRLRFILSSRRLDHVMGPGEVEINISELLKDGEQRRV